MGCDIHMCIEYKPFDTWWTFGIDVQGDRHYQMFEAMAGVRSEDENAVVLPRGLPTDMSWPICEMFGEEESKLSFLNGDHSPSWLYADEFEKACIKAKIPDTIPEKDDHMWIIIRRLIRDLAQMYGEKNIRLVFNFDN